MPDTVAFVRTRAARTPWGWWVAWTWLGAVVLAAVFAPLLPLWDPTIPDYRAVFSGITPSHWLGGDTLGRDTFSRVVHGARASLLVGICAVGIGAIVGGILGMIAGYFGGRTERVLASLDIDDARLAYRAIAIANPGGLGDAPEQSVHEAPTVDLRTAMSLAADRDSIARQYANGFADVFDAAQRANVTKNTAILGIFLSFLAALPDSHIVRKQGAAMAQSVTRDAAVHHARWLAAGSPADDPELAAWDAELKARGINPGTSADLAVAALFVALMTA